VPNRLTTGKRLAVGGVMASTRQTDADTQARLATVWRLLRPLTATATKSNADVRSVGVPEEDRHVQDVESITR
jgi:hypothetical protein